MTTHITKTWFVDGKIIEQEIPEAAIYKREWVGLTDEEVRECYGHVEGVTVSEAVILMSVVRTTQAALKEKNA